MKIKLFTFLILISTMLFIPSSTFADLQEGLENISFEFIYPQDGYIVVMEDCELTKHIENALVITYDASFSSNIMLKISSWEPNSERAGIYTYNRYDNTYRKLIWGNLTSTTYALKAEPVDPETEEVLSDGREITYDVVCLDELNEEEREQYLNLPKPEQKPDSKPEEITEKIKETTPIEEEGNTEKPQTKGVRNIVEDIKKIFTDIRDIFTWNISFENIDWDSFIPQEKDAGEEFPKEKVNKKPFGFPFEKIIGVTQWYGNTAYQQPHTGIDFGATKETIISPGDGEIVALGWDNFNGECFSGGNYLVLKHSNGMHTAYFHIEKYFVKLGDLVKRGERIAVSGNSGKWNCQNLGYHLHFETRLGRYQDTHVNPIDYIDVNWEDVPTLGYRYNPGRLSGENPHPTY